MKLIKILQLVIEETDILSHKTRSTGPAVNLQYFIDCHLEIPELTVRLAGFKNQNRKKPNNLK